MYKIFKVLMLFIVTFCVAFASLLLCLITANTFNLNFLVLKCDQLSEKLAEELDA